MRSLQTLAQAYLDAEVANEEASRALASARKELIGGLGLRRLPIATVVNGQDVVVIRMTPSDDPAKRGDIVIECIRRAP